MSVETVFANAKWFEFFGQKFLAQTQFIILKLKRSRDACPIRSWRTSAAQDPVTKSQDYPVSFGGEPIAGWWSDEANFLNNLLTSPIAWLFGWFNTIIRRFLLIYLLGTYLLFWPGFRGLGPSTFAATCLLFTEMRNRRSDSNIHN